MTPCGHCLGPDAGPVPIAGVAHCRACADLVDAQMAPQGAWPGQPAQVQMFRCQECGVARFGRTGELTRCLVCTDERAGLYHRDTGDLLDCLVPDWYRNRLDRLMTLAAARPGPA